MNKFTYTDLRYSPESWLKISPKLVPAVNRYFNQFNLSGAGGLYLACAKLASLQGQVYRYAYQRRSTI